MPKNIDPIKQQIVETALKQGDSARKALTKAHYSEGHIMRSTKNKIVKDSRENIMKELRAADITPELLINRLNEDRELARRKGDISTMTRVDELLGKFITMFSDRQVLDANVMTNEEQSTIDKYIHSNRLGDTQGN